MYTSVRPAAKQKDFRAKAQLNLSIATDLSYCFGGRKADYLKRLNHRLKKEIQLSVHHYRAGSKSNSTYCEPNTLDGSHHE